ncbi:anthranilate synthase component I [Marinicella sp. W31]|uniref:anthranilate synthase component I n=1 Tax=Marinicella sp. W31 TaxID=3023713 RepID=UPI00375733DB
MLTEQEFNDYVDQGYNRIPLYQCISADLDTPLSAWLKLANGPHTFLLESVQGGARWGRYSFIGLSASHRYEFSNNSFRKYLYNQLISEETCTDILAQVQQIKSKFKVPPIDDLPSFSGGLVGYLGYEIITHIESKLAELTPPDKLNIPDVNLMLAEELAVFDNLAGKVWLIVHVNPDEPQAFAKGQHRLEELVHRLRSGSTGYAEMINRTTIDESDFVTGFTQEEFTEAVLECKELIESGDIFQVVLSQRISTAFHARPLDVYRALRASNPSPYMYFMDFGDYQVVGSSPEVLVRRQDDTVTLRPIAGTRPRGKTPEEDRALEAELLNDPKELAEHLMLIDLGRNDVGRIAEIGSVNLVDKMVIEHYSHVMHIVSEIQGQLQAGKSNAEIIKAVFPAGTLSGAPKVRAMEVIAALEKVKRNVYAGAVGYWGWHDDMDMAIAIRTAVIKDNALHVQAGAGIVADSVPESEWQEIMNKAKAVLRAVSMASDGL